MLCSQMKSQFFFFICTFGIDFFWSDFLWAKCCKWKYFHPVVSLQLSSWFSLFVTPNTGRHWQLLHCVWQRSPVEKATSHWPRSGNNVCLWIPGKKKKKGSRDRQQKEWMTCLHCQFSSWKAIVMLLVELCSWGLSSLLMVVPTRHPLVLGSPLYLPVVGFLFLLLLLLMRWIIIIATTNMAKILL